MFVLTRNHQDSDDDMRRHRLDDVARPLTCQVVALGRHPSSVGLLTWHCDIFGDRTTVGRGGGGWRQW